MNEEKQKIEMEESADELVEMAENESIKFDYTKWFTNIQGFMIHDLNLNGNQLLIYSLIYGFSQDGKSWYNGSLRFISAALKIDKVTTVRNLKLLEDSELIEKRIRTIGNSYRVILKNIGGCKTQPPKIASGCKTQQGGLQNATASGCKMQHNTYNTNINTNTVEKVVVAVATEKKTIKKNVKEEVEFILLNEIQKLIKKPNGERSPQMKILKYIGWMMDKKISEQGLEYKDKIKNKSQFNNFIRRHIKAAKILSEQDITSKQMEYALAKIHSEWYNVSKSWTLETINKALTS